TMIQVNVPSAGAAGPVAADMGISSQPLKMPGLPSPTKNGGPCPPFDHPFRKRASLRGFAHRLLVGALLVVARSLLVAAPVAAAERPPRTARAAGLDALVAGSGL